MKILAMALLFAISVAAQSANVMVGGKTVVFSVPAPIVVTSIQCFNPDGSTPATTPIVLYPGQQSKCTVTMSGPTSSPLTITPYQADPPLVLSPAVLTLAANTTLVSFFVQRPALTAQLPTVKPPFGLHAVGFAD